MGGGTVTEPEVVNQLVIATTASMQAGPLTERLVRDGFYVTQVNSSGGLLYEATVSLLIGLDKRRLARVLTHIRECCPTRRRFVPTYIEPPVFEAQSMMIEADVGGAKVYVLDVEYFERL